MIGIYGNDSLFTLSGLQIAGVLGLAGVQAGAVLWSMRGLVRTLRWPQRFAAAIVAIWLFEWLSPQVFYTYYRAIIPGLPAQWVIGWPPSPSDLMLLAVFQSPPSLSAHGRAVLFWLLAAVALWPRRAAAN